MKKKSFYIRFYWKSTPKKLFVQTHEATGSDPVKALYQIYWKNNYLFSVYPTFNRNSTKVWTLLEQERAEMLPAGFVHAVGQLIEEKTFMGDDRQQ